MKNTKRLSFLIVLLSTISYLAFSQNAEADKAKALVSQANSSTKTESQAKEKPRLLIIPFVIDRTITEDENRNLSGILESQLINSGMFESYSFEEAVKIATEKGLANKFEDADSAISLGKAIGVQFVIFGRAGQKAKDSKTGIFSITLNPTLVSIDTSKQLFGQPANISLGKTQIESLTALSKKIINAFKQRSDVTLAQVDAFIKASDWTNAERYFDIYSGAHPDEISKLAERNKKINTTIAQIRYTDAQTSLRLFLFEQARAAIQEALLRAQGNPTYMAFAEEIETTFSTQNKMTDSKLLSQANDLLKEKKFEVVFSVLDLLEKRGSKDGRIPEYRILAQNGLKAENLKTDAEAFLASGKFDDALSYMNEALNLVPDDHDYLRLRNRIVDQEKRDSKNKEKWELYMEEFANLDIPGLFLNRKELASKWYISFDSTTFNYLVPLDSKLAPSYQVWPGLNQLALRYDSKFFQPFIMPLSFTDLNLYWFANINGFTGSKSIDSISTTNQVEIMTDSFFMMQAAGGASAKLTVLSYVLSLDLDFNSGFINATRETRVPFDNNAISISELMWTIGTGYGACLTWYPANNYCVGLRYRRNDFLVIPRQKLLDITYSYSFGLEVGIKL